MIPSEAAKSATICSASAISVALLAESARTSERNNWASSKSCDRKSSQLRRLHNCNFRGGVSVRYGIFLPICSLSFSSSLSSSSLSSSSLSSSLSSESIATWAKLNGQPNSKRCACKCCVKCSLGNTTNVTQAGLLTQPKQYWTDTVLDLMSTHSSTTTYKSYATVRESTPTLEAARDRVVDIHAHEIDAESKSRQMLKQKRENQHERVPLISSSQQLQVIVSVRVYE